MNIFQPDFVSDNYFIATYFLESKTSLRDAAWELAIGQSVGNPKVRSEWETEELFKNHSVIVLSDEDSIRGVTSGIVKFAFPLANIDFSGDGVSQLLCHLMGGQMDIDTVLQCHLNELQLPEHVETTYFRKPKFGITGTREITGVYNRPLLGGIVKPKVIDKIETLISMVHEMVDGGVNFIKEDEIMANPSSCPLTLRVKEISKIIEKTNVVYTYCINGDNVVDRAKQVYELGGRGVHVNFWSGLGSYKAIRELDLPLFIHFQKSGDKVLTNPSHAYHIKWDVICYLAGLMGADSIHAGMWGGYMNEEDSALQKTLNVLHTYNTIPALSCGMHPGLIEAINNRFGVDYMANVGGALHGHPLGTKEGARAMRGAIDNTYGESYDVAISKWGKVT
jgi:ribulose 1,5-bisphosphate carboxylase large subunit-like protein